MDSSIVVFLIFLKLQGTLCDIYENATFPHNVPSAELIIFTTGGPVPDYLLNSNYKIVPLPNRSSARRADDFTSTVKVLNKESQNLTIDEDYARDTSVKYMPRTSNRELRKQRKQKNGYKYRVRNHDRNNQQVDSLDAVVADSKIQQQKGQITSTKRMAISNISKRPDYINDTNDLRIAPSNLNRDRNAVNTNPLYGTVYTTDANKLTAPSNMYRDRNLVNSDESNQAVSIDDASIITTGPSFLLPGEKFPTSSAYSPLSPVYSRNPSFVAAKIPASSMKINKAPKPTLKSYETALHDLKPFYKPYSFGYNVFDGFGSKQYRQESATKDGVVQGNYGYKDIQGIYRLVEYIADANGFRAVLKSNEPGLANVDTADVSIIVDPPPVWVPSEKLVL